MGAEVNHLVANKGRYQHASCDGAVKTNLVEAVGEVTCVGCREWVAAMFGEDPVRRMYERVDARKVE